jgi:hypothetical protein
VIALPLAAWRLVFRRAGHDRLVVAAAFLTVLLATTLLASGPIYAEAVALSGLRRTLEDAPVAETSVQISSRLEASAYRGADSRVAAAVGSVFGDDGATVFRSGRSDSYELPGAAGVPRDALAVLAFYDGLPEHARLVAGHWPTGSGSEPVAAALPAPAAEALGLEQGDSITLAPVGGEAPAALRLAGLYEVDDAADPFWRGSPLETGGREQIGYTTFGPFVVSRAAFFALGAGGAQARWRVSPRPEGLTVAELPRVRAGLGGLEDRLRAGGAGTFAVESGLAPVLSRTERALVVARSGVLVPSVQLGILAAAALLFLAGLLAERRSVEAAIMRARGASPGEIGMLALAEGALLAAPAAAAAPWLAALSLHALNHVGPLAAIGLELRPHVDREAYLLAAGAAALGAVALAAPALRSASVAAVVREQGRPPARGLVQRAGLDLVLVAVAALAYWQLRRYQGPVVESIRGRLGIDPLLVAAPALGLLAGAVLALRIVPAAAALAERASLRARGLVAPLSTRQVARRPHRYARSALLLTLALAIGLFASAYGDTWLRSQEDRAAYEAGADVRVSPDERTGSIPTAALARAYAGVEGVRSALPVVSGTVDLPGAAGAANVIAVDAARAGAAVSLRGDLSGRPPAELLRQLAARRPEPAVLRLPGRPARIELAVRLRTGRLRNQDVLFFPDLRPSLAVVVRDSAGLLYRLPAGALESDGRLRRVTLRPGAGAELDYPLELLSFELQVNPLFRRAVRGTLTVESLDPLAAAGADWSVDVSQPQGLQSAPDVVGVRGGDRSVIRLDFTSGAAGTFFGNAPITFTAFPGQSSAPAHVPAVVTDRFLEETGSEVGDAVPLGPGGPRLVSVASVRGFPPLPPDAGGIVVDLPTWLLSRYLRDGDIPEADEWWIDAAPGEGRSVARRLEAAPFSSREVVDREGTARRLSRDPVALGITGALSLGFVAAAVFAVVGFAVAAAVSASERRTEFAVLRSLGLSPRQLSGWLALEGALTAVLAVMAGIALGALVAWLVLPYVSLAGEGGRPFPGVIVQFPWPAAALLSGGMLAVLAVVLAAQIVVLRRLALAPALRAGVDT